MCKTFQKMSLREIDLNENITNSYEDNQDEIEYHIPDLNVSVEELDISFNQSPSTSTTKFSSPSHFFDLNDELFMEDGTQIREVLLQSNSNNGISLAIFFILGCTLLRKDIFSYEYLFFTLNNCNLAFCILIGVFIF